MDTVPLAGKMTLEEYLGFEALSETKHEYHRGEVFAMAGASIAHNTIVSNTISEIGSFLKGKSCRVFPSDLKIRVESADLFTYPDLSIVCEEPKLYHNSKDTIVNPVVIIEVLSDSTESYDRTEKFAFYRRIPSLKEYILISSAEMRIEKYLKKADFVWEYQEYPQGSSSFTIESTGQEILINEIYRNLAL